MHQISREDSVSVTQNSQYLTYSNLIVTARRQQTSDVSLGE